MNDKNLLRSFQVEIVLCSFVSLVCAIVTEFVIFVSFRFYGKNVIKSVIGEPTKLYGSSVLQNVKPMRKELIIILVIVALAVGVLLFVTYFLLFTKKYSKYLSEICDGIREISAGEFNTRIPVRNKDEFSIIASNINKMASDVSIIMESERNSEKAKHDLITNIAHDLRTPLTSIIGYLDLASREQNIEGEQQKKYVSIAYENSKRLENLIEDLFHISKFSSGEITPVKGEIDIVKLLEQLMEEFYPSFQAESLESEFASDSESIYVVADGNLLARAFANLIGNAVKYGRDGKNIRIHIRKNQNTVSIAVINYGELIPQEDINNIFEKFYRVESSRSRDTGGSGLGLAIAKTVIEMHDGTITAKSDYDGTVFEVVLNLSDSNFGDK